MRGDDITLTLWSIMMAVSVEDVPKPDQDTLDLDLRRRGMPAKTKNIV